MLAGGKIRANNLILPAERAELHVPVGTMAVYLMLGTTKRPFGGKRDTFADYTALPGLPRIVPFQHSPWPTATLSSTSPQET